MTDSVIVEVRPPSRTVIVVSSTVRDMVTVRPPQRTIVMVSSGAPGPPGTPGPPGEIPTFIDGGTP